MATPPPEALFVGANAWTGALPADAERIAPEEFRRRQAAGELQVLTADTPQAQRQARRSRVEAERSYLAAQTDLSEAERDLLAQAAVSSELDAAPGAALPDGRRVSTLDLATRIEAAAAARRLAGDKAHALGGYTLSYGLLSAAQQAALPTPASLSAATLAEVRAATAQLDALLATQDDLDRTRLDATAPVTPLADRMRPLNAGNGADNSGACTPRGYARTVWFPLRAFVSPVKNQGSRGTCWAFTAVAAVESRERVQNNNPADLSEQFLVNKVKREWFPADFIDGGSARSALEAAADRNQSLAPESAWTYNRAASRPANAFDAGVVGTAASYSGACAGYNTPLCSETAHQSQRLCTTVQGTSYCGYGTVSFGGGVASSRVQQVWSSGQPFNLNQLRALLASGVSLMASFPVYEGVMAAPATGIVSDYARQRLDAAGMRVDGDYGGHLAQIVGFVPNEQLSYPGGPEVAAGGGYFILRNSWGCAGDGGYYYVPADYVSSRFSTLEALQFDARRSAAWTAEQTVPGGSSGLAVNAAGSQAADLRVRTDLAGSFSVTHPAAAYVRLTVRSNVDGLLYDGQWLVNAPPGGVLFNNALPVSFNTAGLRTLTFRAQYGTQTVGATKDILVLNTPPRVLLSNPGTPQQGEPFVLNATVSDVNETDVAGLCSAMAWSVDAPDAIVSGSGCTRTVRFGSTGTRQVRVSTQDREGAAAAAVGSFAVAAPPVNPYPRVNGFGAFARDGQYIGGVRVGCTSHTVTDSATIDLRDLGCVNSVFGGELTRYTSRLTVENPAAEALSYDWVFTMNYAIAGVAPVTVRTRTTTPAFDMAPLVFGARDTPYRCTVDVRVNAPDPKRSKSLRVWSGQCINVADVPR